MGGLQSYISNVHPELKKFVWDKYCDPVQQWESTLSDWVPRGYSLVQGYPQGHTLSGGRLRVEQRGLTQKRLLAAAAASLASGEHARKRQRQLAAGAKGTGPFCNGHTRVRAATAEGSAHPQVAGHRWPKM